MTLKRRRELNLTVKRELDSMVKRKSDSSISVESDEVKISANGLHMLLPSREFGYIVLTILLDQTLMI